MAITYGFYNSVGGDRTYNAVEFSSIFDGVITDGVFQDVLNGLDVVSSSGMNVVVESGRAWFDHTWTLNDADLTVAIPASDLTNPRIDTVVLEVNASNLARQNTIQVIQGTPAGSPVPATLINTTEIHQHPLGYVYVPAGASSISAGNVTNLVGTISCPYATVPTAMSPAGTPADVLEVQVFM